MNNEEFDKLFVPMLERALEKHPMDEVAYLKAVIVRMAQKESQHENFMLDLQKEIIRLKKIWDRVDGQHYRAVRHAEKWKKAAKRYRKLAGK